MWIRVQRHTNVSKQAMLLDGLDVSPLKWRVCGNGLNRFVHEGMNHISNVKVHLKTRSGNVNIHKCTPPVKYFTDLSKAVFCVDHLCNLCLVFVMLSRLFIAALWSPEGKGLTS